jgi:hypothetical protein
MSQHGLKHAAFAIVVNKRHWFVPAGDLGPSRGQNLDRLVSLLAEIKLVDRLERLHPGHDRMVGLCDFDHERSVLVVPAFSRSVIPDAAADIRSPLGPVGISRLGEREMKRAVREMHDRQSAPIFEVLHKILLGGIAESRLHPVAVVEHEHVVLVQFRFGQKLDVLDDAHVHPDVAGQRFPQGGRGVLPEMAGVLVTGYDQRLDRRTGQNSGDFLVGVELGLDPLGGNVASRRPDERVEDQLAELGLFPVVVEVPAGGGKTASPVFPFDRPGDDVVEPVAQFGNPPDRLESGIVFAEANLEVELLAEIERFESPGDRVIGRVDFHPRLKRLDRRVPVPLALLVLPVEVTASPFENVLPPRIGGEGREVKRDESAPAPHLLAHHGHSLFGHPGDRRKLVSVLAVGDRHDRVGVVQRGRIERPAVEMNFDLVPLEIGRRLEHRLEQPDRFLVFVNSRPVTLLARDQNDFLGLGGFLTECGRAGGRQDCTEQQESAEKRFHQIVPRGFQRCRESSV